MKRSIELTDSDNRLLTQQAQRWADEHLRLSGKRGRPAYLSEYVSWLLRQQVKGGEPPRATFRSPHAKKVDQAATAAFAKRWHAHPTRLHEFKEVDPIIRAIVPSADRPQRIIQATYGFCQREVLAPFTQAEGTWGRIGQPRLDLIPDYSYGLFAYVRPLEEFA
jgi:hypothetical protein